MGHAPISGRMRFAPAPLAFLGPRVRLSSMNTPVLLRAIPPEDQAAFEAAVGEGIEAADAGRPFEPVAEWLETWGTEGEPPPPQ